MPDPGRNPRYHSKAVAKLGFHDESIDASYSGTPRAGVKNGFVFFLREPEARRSKPSPQPGTASTVRPRESVHRGTACSVTLIGAALCVYVIVHIV